MGAGLGEAPDPDMELELELVAEETAEALDQDHVDAHARVLGITRARPGSMKHCLAGQTSSQAMASRPFAFTSANSLSDGPDGFFWPRSHSPTSFTATLRCRAKTL
jgi:hypothetical protein